jgi:hypothetical protein
MGLTYAERNGVREEQMSEGLLSRDLAEEIEAAFDPGLAVREELGYAAVFPGDLPGFAALRDTCMAIFRDRQDAAQQRGKKAYLRPILERQDLEAHPEIVGYALNSSLLAAAARYLGVPPSLRSVQFFYTPQNESEIGSQMFHFDHIGERQLKMFVYLTPVSEDTGPFVFAPANLSAKVLERTGEALAEAHLRRFSDEEVAAVVDASELVMLTGPAGAGGLVDTTRCLHYGGRARSGERHMMIIQYARPGDIVAQAPVPPVYPHPERLSALQRAALDLVPA